MHFPTALVVLCTVYSSANAVLVKNLEVRAFRELNAIMKREVCTSGSTCAQCFGAGNIDCGTIGCYNPSAGESCCSDGNYCRAGTYCAVGGICCPTGSTTADCQAGGGALSSVGGGGTFPSVTPLAPASSTDLLAPASTSSTSAFNLFSTTSASSASVNSAFPTGGPSTTSSARATTSTAVVVQSSQGNHAQSHGAFAALIVAVGALFL